MVLISCFNWHYCYFGAESILVTTSHRRGKKHRKTRIQFRKFALPFSVLPFSGLTDTGFKNYAPELRRPKGDYKVSIFIGI